MPENKNKVLIVDDDEIILLALRESLIPRGYEVFTYTNPEEALTSLNTNKYAVIVSDQRMAEMNGLKFLSECRTIQPNASRVLITGVQTLKTLIDAVNKSEIYRFVAKPWIREDLLRIIDSAAERYLKLATQERELVQLREEVERLRNT